MKVAVEKVENFPQCEDLGYQYSLGHPPGIERPCCGFGCMGGLDFAGAVGGACRTSKVSDSCIYVCLNLSGISRQKMTIAPSVRSGLANTH